MTSTNRIPVIMVISQVRKKRQIEGTNPARAVSTGSPNIPAPIDVPTTRDTAVTNFKSKTLVKTAFSMRAV
jgi:hypothetical protein